MSTQGHDNPGRPPGTTGLGAPQHHGRSLPLGEVLAAHWSVPEPFL
jgi:hypothetical protein